LIRECQANFGSTGTKKPACNGWLLAN